MKYVDKSLRLAEGTGLENPPTLLCVEVALSIMDELPHLFALGQALGGSEPSFAGLTEYPEHETRSEKAYLAWFWPGAAPEAEDLRRHFTEQRASESYAIIEAALHRVMQA